MILNKCPLCGEELEYISLCQYSEAYKITKFGKLSARRKYKRDEGPIDAAFIKCCTCDFMTNCDFECENYPDVEIYQDNDGTFIVTGSGE